MFNIYTVCFIETNSIWVYFKAMWNQWKKVHILLKKIYRRISFQAERSLRNLFRLVLTLITNCRDVAASACKETGNRSVLVCLLDNPESYLAAAAALHNAQLPSSGARRRIFLHFRQQYISLLWRVWAGAKTAAQLHGLSSVSSERRKYQNYKCDAAGLAGAASNKTNHRNLRRAYISFSSLHAARRRP